MFRNRIIWAILFLILFIGGFFLYQQVQPKVTFAENGLWENYKIQNKTIGGRELKLVVAETPEQMQKGLMFVRKPVDFDGMIFTFPNYEPRTFWNMNTFEDLTIYWMKDEEIRGTSDLPSIEKSGETVRVSSPEPVNIVVEIIN